MGAIRRVLVAAVGLVAFGLPVMVAIAPAAHAAPSTCTGNLQVTDTDTHTVVGFVSNVWNSFGEYVVTTTPSQYLTVSVAPGAQGNVLASNAQNASFPYVGGIQGFASSNANLGVGSFNYAYLGGTTQTAAGATPQSGANAFTSATGIAEDIESAIWTGNGNIAVTPQWINTDGSQPATHLVDITGILVITGDVSAFTGTFGAADDVALALVPTSPCPNTNLALTGVPSNITTTATSGAGAVVSYTAPTATDTGGADAAATVGCLPASGSTFPVGTTTVTCTATDPNVFNSPVSASFTVTVNKPSLSFTGVPANITTTATQHAGATVTYTAPTALLAGSPDPDATVSCLPASGSVFPLGTTTVTCTATDAAAANSPLSATFTVTVNKANLSFTGVPANVTTTATQHAGATVTYTAPTALLAGSPDPDATVSCLPASGSVFPLDTTTVTCTATDSAAANSPLGATFTVTVKPGPLNHLVLSPANSTITVGFSQTYTARGADQFGNDLGDKTAATTFTVNNGGTCTANSCTGPPGTDTVTGTTGSPPVTGTATLTVVRAGTTTTLVASASSPAFGSPVTFTATVKPSPANPLTPTGTVSFFVDGSATPVATVPLNAAGKASVTFSGLGAGSHSITAIYSGDANFKSSTATAATVTVGCTTTITGNHSGTVTVSSGSTCIAAGARISGAIVVTKGGSLDLESATVTGSINTNGAALVRICGSSVGPVNINGSTGFVVIGDAVDGCATNTIGGSLTVLNNTGGVQVIGNTVAGAVTASGNSGAGPFPDDSGPNVSGNGP